jgi:hemerythrin superfamily protein
MNVLDHLIEEHRKIDALVAGLAELSPGDDREHALRELESALETHVAVEETFVYPLVNRFVGRETDEGARNEHELIQGELFQARTLVAEPGFAAAVHALRAGLRRHVEAEETQIFPRLRNRAATQLSELGDAEDLEVKVTDRALQVDVTDGQSSSDMTPAELRAAIERFEASRHANERTSR